MFCKNCGSQIDASAYACTNCGFAKGSGRNFCDACGSQINPGAAVCTNCGKAVGAPAGSTFSGSGDAFPGQKSKLIAILLAFFLGGFGAHDFYLGYTNYGVIKLVLTLVTCGVASSIWALIDIIRLLTGAISTDANGAELKKEF